MSERLKEHTTAAVSADDGEAASRRRERPGAADIAVLGTAVALFGALVWQVRAFITDDAFISLRYARNLAEGYGPVWNPGGPPVEGYSNPLLVLVEAGVYRVFGAGGETFARVLGVAAGLALIAAVWWLGRAVVGVRAANAAALLTAASPALAYWSVGGLETLPIALVVTTATLLLARGDGGNPVVVGAMLATLGWLRPEGLALAGALVSASEIGGLVDRGRREQTLRRLVWLAGLPLLSQVGLQALRWAWFGHLLPNSVIYKAGTGTVAAVTVKFLREAAPIVVLAVAGFFAVPRRARLLAAIPLLYFAASFTFRDSVNTYSRLVLPALPLVLVLAAAALPGVLARLATPRRDLVAAAAGTAAAVVVGVLFAPVSILHARDNAQAYMACRDLARRDAGLWLRANAPDDATFVIGDAGLVPFVAERTTIDLFGLNEPWMQELGPTPAQWRADRAVGLAPEFFVLSSRSRDAVEPHYPVDRRVRDHPEFQAAYEPEAVAGADSGCDYHLHIFGRSDL